LNLVEAIPTFIQHGLLFNGSPEGADPSIDSLESFFIFACRYGFCDARVAKGVSTWLFCNYQDLDIEKVTLLLTKESNETRVFAEAISNQVSSLLGSPESHEFGAVRFVVRVNSQGELGDSGSPHFEKYNASMPSLKPDVKKYIRVDLRKSKE
jgi:hypothetical protein